MRATCTFFLLVLVCQAGGAPDDQKDKVKTLDWSLVPVEGDKDWKEKAKKLLAEYKGAKVTAEGTLASVQSAGPQAITVTLTQPAKRGDLSVTARVGVTFRDLVPDRVQALVKQQAKGKVVGTPKESTGSDFPLLIDDAQLVGEKKATKKP